MCMIKIGKIVSVTGLRGEVKACSYAQKKERFDNIICLNVDDEEYEIESVRHKKNTVILKLSGINDRNAAESLKNKDIYIKEEDLEELPSDTYYVKDLIGLDAVCDDGARIGAITNILQNTQQDVYEIKKEDGNTALIPAVPEFLKDIDLENGVVVFSVIEGLLSINDK